MERTTSSWLMQEIIDKATAADTAQQEIIFVVHISKRIFSFSIQFPSRTDLAFAQEI